MKAEDQIIVERKRLKAEGEYHPHITTEGRAIAAVIDRLQNDIRNLIAKQNKLAAESNPEDQE